jgi:hypothetical protein
MMSKKSASSAKRSAMHTTEDLLNEVQELTWALIDDQATDKDVARLEELLVAHNEARQTYVECMRLHTDLHFFFGPPPRLPQVLEKVLASKEKTPPKTEPLPIVNFPTSHPAVPLHNGFH